MTGGSHVLVGYDGTKESDRAMRWAVHEARLRRLPLTVCHAWHWPYPISHIDYEGVAIVKRMGQHTLDSGADLARALAPGLEVRKRMLEGPAYLVLLHEVQEADLIVIGSHGPDEAAVGSTVLQLPKRATRPVLVVRAAAHRHEQVVVGVDGSPAADVALGFGFEEAVLRGWRLRAVCGCWDPEAAPAGDLSVFGDEDRLRHECGVMLEKAVAPWRVKYPQVDCRTSLILRPPREALFEAADEADLAVLGNRGTGQVKPLTLGSTSEAMLQHAPCTLAIVQPAYTA